MEATTINVETDRITPSSVRNERSLWARRVSSAIRVGSLSATRRRRAPASPETGIGSSPAAAGAIPLPCCGLSGIYPTPLSKPESDLRCNTLEDEIIAKKFHLAQRIPPVRLAETLFRLTIFPLSARIVFDPFLWACGAVGSA